MRLKKIFISICLVAGVTGTVAESEMMPIDDVTATIDRGIGSRLLDLVSSQPLDQQRATPVSINPESLLSVLTAPPVTTAKIDPVSQEVMPTATEAEIIGADAAALISLINEHNADEPVKTVQQIELETFCEQIDKKLTSVGYEECLTIGLVDSGAQSNDSTPLLYRDILPADDDPVARVLVIGGIHGDEYSSVSVVFKWLAMLSEDFGEHFHWRIVPVLNPDGLLQPPTMSQRVNANGVDLNRNFPTPDWETEAPAYWIDHTRRNKRRYPGPSPLSEPESAWLAEQLELFKPHAVISVHAPHGVVDFDGPHVPPPQLGPLQLRLLGTYPGSMGRYIGIHKGVPLLTVELESAFGMPEKNELYDIWYDMLGWLHEKIAQPMKLAKEHDATVAAPELMRSGIDPDNEG